MRVKFHSQLFKQDIWNLDVDIVTPIFKWATHWMVSCHHRLAKGRDTRNKKGRICCIALDLVKWFNSSSGIFDRWSLKDWVNYRLLFHFVRSFIINSG